jgi:hypothetical protein
MTIFASPYSDLPIVLENLTDGQTLVYDEENGVFVNKYILPQNLNFITSAKNLISNNSYKIFKEVNGNRELLFRTLLPGYGIGIQETNDNLIISVNSSNSVFSSTSDLELIINSEGLHPGSHLNLFKAIPVSSIVKNINVLAPVTINDLYTGISVSGKSFIKSSSFQFHMYGFTSDMLISLENSPDQDGIYLIDSIVSHSSGTTVFFKNSYQGAALFNLGGPKYPTTIKQASAWIPDNDGDLGPNYSNDLLYSVQFWNLDVSGLIPGMIITITGSENNLLDGNYRIEKIFISGMNDVLNWPGIIFHPSTPLPPSITQGVVFDEDLFNNKLKLISQYSIVPTGFKVSDDGVIYGNRFVSVSGYNPISGNDLTNKYYVDNKINNEINNFNDLVVSSVSEIINDLKNKIENISERTKKSYLYYMINAKF